MQRSRYSLMGLIALCVFGGVIVSQLPWLPSPPWSRRPIQAPAHPVRQADEMFMYGIFERPKDYPAGFVVRKFVVAPMKVTTAEVVGTAPTLEEARKLVPGKHWKLDRQPNDPAFLVETWLPKE